MATLKDHQQAMVDLLASGSGIPASASRLAHAMHDLIDVLYVAFPNLPRTKDEDWLNVSRETRLTITPDVTLDVKDLIRSVEANTPGLNDRALAADVEACEPLRPENDMYYRAKVAERRVKELENTIWQLKVRNAELKDSRDAYKAQAENFRAKLLPEQAGCRKQDTQAMCNCGSPYSHYDESHELQICNSCHGVK